MAPLGQTLVDEAWSDTSIGQVDGVTDTPLERPGSRVEVEGEKLEAEEASMKVWSQVRKRGQVEKNVSAEARGREEFQSKFPYLGHCWRHGWSKMKEVKEWLAGGDEKEWVEFEEELKKKATADTHKKVEKWLRGGGGLE